MFKNNNNNLDKILKEAKSEYLKKGFEDKFDKWKFLKHFNNSYSINIPSRITFMGNIINSPKKLL